MSIPPKVKMKHSNGINSVFSYYGLRRKCKNCDTLIRGHDRFVPLNDIRNEWQHSEKTECKEPVPYTCPRCKIFSVYSQYSNKCGVCCAERIIQLAEYDIPPNYKELSILPTIL